MEIVPNQQIQNKKRDTQKNTDFKLCSVDYFELKRPTPSKDRPKNENLTGKWRERRQNTSTLYTQTHTHTTKIKNIPILKRNGILFIWLNNLNYKNVIITYNHIRMHIDKYTLALVCLGIMAIFSWWSASHSRKKHTTHDTRAKENERERVKERKRKSPKE